MVHVSNTISVSLHVGRNKGVVLFGLSNFTSADIETVFFDVDRTSGILAASFNTFCCSQYRSEPFHTSTCWYMTVFTCFFRVTIPVFNTFSKHIVFRRVVVADQCEMQVLKIISETKIFIECHNPLLFTIIGSNMRYMLR